MANEVIRLLSERLSTRAISPEPLPDEVIAELLEAARLAPSCYNKQPWRFLFLESEAARAKGREVLAEGNRVWAGRAPLLIIAHTRPENDCVLPGRAYHQLDLGHAIMSLMLAATARGLVARPMAGFDPKAARALFGLDERDEPLVMLAVGRPSDDEAHLPAHYRGLSTKPRERKPVREIAERL